MVSQVIDHLENFGFAIEEGVIPQSECLQLAEALDAVEAEQRALGYTKYMNDAQVTLFNVHLLAPDLFLDKINIPKVMEVVSSVLHDDFILSNFNASRSVSKGGGKRAHIDSRVPIADFRHTMQIVAMLCLDDFTPENGSTYVWPYSHTTSQDPRKLRDSTDLPGRVQCYAPRGSVIYILGQTWHDIGSNCGNKRRWGVIAYYARWWIKPTFDFTKCGPEIYRRLTSCQKSLFGFNSRPPKYGDDRILTMTKVEDLPEDYYEAQQTS